MNNSKENTSNSPAEIRQDSKYILEIRDVKKSFGGISALKGISMNVAAGEVHAIVGENGAGKSTLIKILTGAHTPTSGSVVYEGREYSGFTPEQSASLGIAAIYQEFNLIPYLSVAENMFFGNEICNGPFCDYKKMREETKKLFSQIGLNVDPAKMVKDLGIAQQQMVEIVKTVSKKAKFIIMDEQESVLGICQRKMIGPKVFVAFTQHLWVTALAIQCVDLRLFMLILCIKQRGQSVAIPLETKCSQY